MSESKSSRDELRGKLLSSHTAKTVILKLFDIEIELHQPSLADVLGYKETEDKKERVADMIIQYAYVPGTKERVFETGDRPQILAWPFGKDVLALQNAIVELTGVDVAGAEEDLKADPSQG